MQDRYVGDLGDFGKFGLLRTLCGTGNSQKESLGVLWYMTPGENHNSDSKHTSYLSPTARNQKQFRACDPELYDELARIVHSGQKSVQEARGGGILPPGPCTTRRP